MKFNDIFLAALIIVVFVVCILVSILAKGLKNIKKNWIEYRCNPLMMPLASWFGHDPGENFSQCIGQMQKGTMDVFTAPLHASQGILHANISDIADSVQNIRKLQGSFRPAMAGNIMNIFGVFSNVLIEFQKFIMGFRDMVMKILAVVTTMLYMINGQALLGESIKNGPIVQTLKTIGGGQASACFHPDTPVELDDGAVVSMRNVNLGEKLANGSIVNGVLRLKGDKLNPYYRLWSNELNQFIFVTGSHKIFQKSSAGCDDVFSNYIDVSQHPKAIISLSYGLELSCLITSDNRIQIGEHRFWDWED